MYLSRSILCLYLPICSLALLELSSSQITMEHVRFDHSDKNIPVHSKQTYQKSFINSVANFSRNLRWAVNFFLYPSTKPQTKENYGFKSLAPAPTHKDLNTPLLYCLGY